jgi:hypothetical protein
VFRRDQREMFSHAVSETAVAELGRGCIGKFPDRGRVLHEA